MKQCTQCGKVYSNEGLNFCLDDGAALIRAVDPNEQETVVVPADRGAGRTQIIRQGVSPVYAYLAIGLLALLAGAAVGVWWMTRENGVSSVKNAPAASNVNSRAENRQQGPSPDDSPDANLPSPTPAASVPVDTAEARSEVQEALDGWLAALRDKDIETRMGFYADRLEAYYTKRDVPASAVRSENIKVFGDYSTLEMEISNIDAVVDPRSGQVTTSFDKSFTFSGDEKDFSGAVRSEFRWKKIRGSWKIVSERDLKVY